MCKIEDVNVHLELRGSYRQDLSTNQHPLPMSPVSLASPPSSPSSISPTSIDKSKTNPFEFKTLQKPGNTSEKPLNYKEEVQSYIDQVPSVLSLKTKSTTGKFILIIILSVVVKF